MVSEAFLMSLIEQMTRTALANFDHRGMIGRIYVGAHYAVLHTYYKSCGPQGFREDKFFLGFHHYKLKQMTPGAFPILTTGAWLAGDH